MFKTVQNDVWAFDTEWVPDPAAGRLLYGLPAGATDLDAVGEMWKRGGATEEDPTPFLKTILCRVVSIAAVQRKARGTEVKLNLLWLPRDTANADLCREGAMLQTFLGAVGKFKPQLVGYNSLGADLKILTQRAVVNGVSVPDFCRRPDKPWEGADYFAKGSDWNLDLMDIVAGWGTKGVSLHEIATLSGIPGKFETDGEQVAAKWLSGQWKDIVEYNCFDALTTYLLWLRMAHVAGHFSVEQYAEEQGHLEDMLIEESAKPGQEYLERYIEEWHRLREATGQM